MSDTIRFSSSMTKFKIGIKKENIFACFSLKILEDTTVRTFPSQFKSIDLGVFDHMACNDMFDKINIPLDSYNLHYNIELGDLEFNAKLESLSAVIKRTKADVPFTEYTLNFIKEIDKEIDPKLSHFLKLKEEDPETGKKKVKWIDTTMTEGDN